MATATPCDQPFQNKTSLFQVRRNSPADLIIQKAKNFLPIHEPISKKLYMPKKFKIITKEVGREKPIETLFTGDVDENYLIKFFGLREPDVEWFKIQRI